MASSLYNYVTETGIIVPDTSDLQSETEDLFKAIFGDSIDMTTETPTGRLVEAITLLKSRILSITAQNANQINMNYATGIYLDMLASLFGIERLRAKATHVYCLLTGTAGTMINAGNVAADADGVEYTLDSDVTLSSTTQTVTLPDGTTITSYVGYGWFTCTETGEVACPVGTLTKIVTKQTGWETVQNVLPGEVGYDVEGDTALRKRIQDSRWDNATFVGSIISRIEAIGTVRECKIWENCTNTADTTTITGVTINPHSVLILVDGGNSSDEQTAVAEAIYETKPAGTDMSTIANQSYVINVTEPLTGQTYAIKYSTPTKIDIEVSVEVRNWSVLGSSATVVEKVRAAVNSWINGEIPNVDGASINQSVYAYEVGSAVSDAIPLIQISNVQVRVKNSASWATSVAIGKIEKANIASLTDIRVTTL